MCSQCRPLCPSAGHLTTATPGCQVPGDMLLRLFMVQMKLSSALWVTSTFAKRFLWKAGRFTKKIKSKVEALKWCQDSCKHSKIPPGPNTPLKIRIITQPELEMLKKMRKQSWIRTKSYWGLFWVETQPTSSPQQSVSERKGFHFKRTTEQQ